MKIWESGVFKNSEKRWANKICTSTSSERSAGSSNTSWHRNAKPGGNKKPSGLGAIEALTNKKPPGFLWEMWYHTCCQALQSNSQFLAKGNISHIFGETHTHISRTPLTEVSWQKSSQISFPQNYCSEFRGTWSPVPTGPSTAFLRLALTLPAPEPDEKFDDFFATQFMNSWPIWSFFH